MQIDFANRYGPIPLDRYDVRGKPVVSLDLRAETGAPIGTPDETAEWPARHPFTLSVFGHVGDDGPPCAEIRCMVDGVEISIVGALTGRPNVKEITPDHAMACTDEGYRRSLATWLGLAAA
jgi:hypothetical protein